MYKVYSGKLLFGIIIFSCLSSTKSSLRFLLNSFVREIKGFCQSSLGNEVDFRDIMNVSPEKQIMPFKTTVNWMFNDIWCYSVIGCFGWKTSSRGFIVSLTLQSGGLSRSCEKQKPYISTTRVYITTKFGSLPWWAPIYKITWPFDHVVLRDHVKN